jgi:hypothetical protein
MFQMNENILINDIAYLYAFNRLIRIYMFMLSSNINASHIYIYIYIYISICKYTLTDSDRCNVPMGTNFLKINKINEIKDAVRLIS